MIKKIKKKIAKGLDITVISRSYDGVTTDYVIEFSDASGLHFSLRKPKCVKKLDNFLYLAERALERKTKEEYEESLSGNSSGLGCDDGRKGKSKQQVDICSYCHEIEFKESACFLAKKQEKENRCKIGIKNIRVFEVQGDGVLKEVKLIFESNDKDNG